MKTSGLPIFLEKSPGEEGVVLIYIRKFHSRAHIKITRYGNSPLYFKYLILNKIAIQWTYKFTRSEKQNNRKNTNNIGVFKGYEFIEYKFFFKS